jgi:hypothetical protein
MVLLYLLPPVLNIWMVVEILDGVEVPNDNLVQSQHIQV